MMTIEFRAVKQRGAADARHFRQGSDDARPAAHRVSRLVAQSAPPRPLYEHRIGTFYEMRR